MGSIEIFNPTVCELDPKPGSQCVVIRLLA